MFICIKNDDLKRNGMGCFLDDFRKGLDSLGGVDVFLVHYGGGVMGNNSELPGCVDGHNILHVDPTLSPSVHSLSPMS